MLFYSLFKPAISLMNILSFKFKIILSSSILFLLLALPAYNIVQEYRYQQKQYQERLNQLDQLKITDITHKKQEIKTIQQKSNQKYFLFFLGFVLIVFTSLYLLIAFYYSLATSLRELEEASNKIAQGETGVSLATELKDEIGRVALTFNAMSQQLTKNLSFLDGYKMAIDETSIVSKTDLKGNITYVNMLFCQCSGYTQEELIGQSHNIIRHPEMPKSTFQEMWCRIKQKKIWKGIIKNRKKSGDYYIVDATILPILDADNNIIEYVAVHHDITELVKGREELAKHKIDLVTSLPNKNRLLEEIQMIKKPILFYLNIDAFMQLNDLYGNDIGDRVLIHMAKLLKSIASQTEAKVYRIYNDEFILLYEEGLVNLDNIYDQFKVIMHDIEESTMDCNAPECVSFTVSGGIAHYGLNNKGEKLILYASIARYRAKLANKKFLLYHSSMENEENYAKNISWIKKIKCAIRDDRFVPYFQPIIDNQTGKIVKYEALIRMVEDERVISPFFFLDIAKKAKLYPAITRIVLDKTLDYFQNYEEYVCSINLSTEDIVDRETRRYICHKLNGYPHPEKIVFEITESEEITDFKIVNMFIRQVRSFGVRISIDDFGTGYANFEYILNLDVDYIKIDGGLIKHIDCDDASRILVEAIIAFSKKLGTKTIVEFVHNQEVYHEVVALGADYSQGYYIGKPKASIF
jgi:PAS domain S-box-containing protein/diguanylate cyclase (GGDEF)-like protein